MKPNFVKWCREYRTENPGCFLGEARDAYNAQFGPRLTQRQAVDGLLKCCAKARYYANAQEYLAELDGWVKEVKSQFQL